MALGARPFYLVLTVFLFSQVITNLWPRHYLHQQQHQHSNSVLSSWMSKRSLDEPDIQVHVTPLAHMFLCFFFGLPRTCVVSTTLRHSPHGRTTDTTYSLTLSLFPTFKEKGRRCATDNALQLHIRLSYNSAETCGHTPINAHL